MTTELDIGPGTEVVKASRARLPRISGTRGLAAAITVPAVLVVGLLVFVVFLAFHEKGDPSGAWTLQNYKAVVDNPLVWTAFQNTILYAFVVLVVAMAFGLPMAWLVERTDFGWGKTIGGLMIARILIPGFFTAMGWMFMFNPRIGSVNQWVKDLFGLDVSFLNVTSIVGMGFVEGLGLSALVYLMACAGLRSMDMSLEEAARTSGASVWNTLRKVTIPLLYPHLLGAGLFVVAIAISSVDVPLIIGLANRHFVFSSYLYLIANPPGGVPEYGIAAAFSTVMIVIALLASWWYTKVLARGRSFQVVTGKGYRPQRVKLGRYRWVAWLFVISYFFWSTLMPALMVVWSSLQPFLVPPSTHALSNASLTNYDDLQWDQVWRSVQTTVELMIVVPTIAVIIAIGFSWVVIRSRLKGRMAYDYVAFLPQAVPPLVFAFGAFLAALRLNLGFELYGTFALLAIVMVLIQLAFGTRMVNSGLVQIHPELEEAGAMSGASGWVILKRITVPLLKATLGYTWLWLALLAFRELTVPVMLGGKDTLTVSVFSWNLYNGGQIGQASAVAIVMMLALLPLLAFVLWLAGRGGRDQTFGGAA